MRTVDLKKYNYTKITRPPAPAPSLPFLFQSLGRDCELEEPLLSLSKRPTAGFELQSVLCTAIRSPACGTRRTLSPGWRKMSLNRTHPASGTGLWVSCTESFLTLWTTRSATRWACARARWPSRGSPRHPTGLRWSLTWPTVWAAGRTVDQTARTLVLTLLPISTRSRGAGWAPGWPVRE